MPHRAVFWRNVAIPTLCSYMLFGCFGEGMAMMIERRKVAPRPLRRGSERRVRPSEGEWDVLLLAESGSESPSMLCRIASDDFDWSPDRKRIVFAPVSSQPGQPPKTTLVVTDTGV